MIHEDMADDGERAVFGTVFVRDLIALLRLLAGEFVSISAANADVDDDGAVDEKDALLILQYDAGWNVTLK